MSKKRISVETTGEAYLALLGERGVDYFFGNGGTDFPPIIEGLAKLRAEGRPVPKPIPVAHEMAALSMAHGYAMITGRPQLVMVHVTVGTANSLLGLINACRMHVPMLFTAGRTPITESGMFGSRNVFIHWAQESFDQGGIAREFVKWDYELRNFEQLETVVDRALAITSSTPPGPVSLILPREVLAEPHKEFSFSATSRMKPSRNIHPDPVAIDEAVRLLAGAKNPVIHVGAAGRDPEAVGELAALAETAAIPVFDSSFREYLNIPTSHPYYMGFDFSKTLAEADVILAIESDVPWMPSRQQPRDDATVIQLAMDPNFSRYPIRGFPVDVPIQAEPAAGLASLREALADAIAGKEKEVEERRKRVLKMGEAMRAEWREKWQSAAKEKPIQSAWLSHCISEAIGQDDIIVNEYTIDRTQTERTVPGTFFDHPLSAGLGWGFGAALGAKLAAPDKTVVATLGDGAYIFSNPVACHWTAAGQNIPILIIVFNNATWGSVKRNVRALFPDGYAASRDDFPFTAIEPSPPFEKICELHGGYGERVEDPGEVAPAIERALHAVREEGRQALLNVVIAKP